MVMVARGGDPNTVELWVLIRLPEDQNDPAVEINIKHADGRLNDDAGWQIVQKEVERYRWLHSGMSFSVAGAGNLDACIPGPPTITRIDILVCYQDAPEVFHAFVADLRLYP